MQQLSTPADGGEPPPIAVNGWREPFLSPASGQLIGQHQDIRASQMCAARRDPRFSAESVANLKAHLAGRGNERYERLPLTAAGILNAQL